MYKKLLHYFIRNIFLYNKTRLYASTAKVCQVEAEHKLST